ncbi:MAG: sensor domain-containing diguanylate cyclase [Phycisphaerae bacterium]|jgi:diguanylate cyclase (GGDEF)-like protein
MSRPTHDVLLVTDDLALRALATRACPPGGRLLCLSHAQSAAVRSTDASQLWLDLDGAVETTWPRFTRHVYFHSQIPCTADAHPPGIYLRKPCLLEALAILWAEAAGESRIDRRALALPQQSESLPGWLMEFQELSLAGLCQRCVSTLPERLGYREAALYLFDAQRALLTLAEAKCSANIELSIGVEATNRHVLSAVVRTAVPITSDDLRESCAGVGLTCPPDVMNDTDRTALIAPLAVGDSVVGALRLGKRVAGHQAAPPSPAVWSFLARALEHARAYERACAEARIDVLTGLFNYRWLSEALEREIRRAERFRSRLSVLQVDLDDFKSVNDCFGHPTGDALLRHAASRIRAGLRTVDAAVRTGGDEFVVLLPETDLSGAKRVGERVLAAIRDNPPVIGDRPLPITASVGAAEWQHGWSLYELLEAADRAMYASKRDGRDRLTLAPRDDIPSASYSAHAGPLSRSIRVELSSNS